MGRLSEVAFSDRALRAAWSAVLAADQSDGVTAPSIERFERDLDDNIGRLVADLAWSTYQPGTLSQVQLPKDDGVRILGIPPARDRVVARALLQQLTPLIDPLLGPASYAYRPGLGVSDAVQAVVALREEGLGWVLRTDINDCFASISLTHLQRLLHALVDDPEVLSVLDLLQAVTSSITKATANRFKGSRKGARCPRSSRTWCSASSTPGFWKTGSHLSATRTTWSL